MSFAPADDNDDGEPAEAAEADAEPNDDHDDGTGETTAQDAQEIDLAYLPEENDSERTLVEAVETNAEELTHRAPEHRVDKLEKTIDALQEENRELQEHLDALEDRIKSLEGWRSNTVNTVNENIRSLNRLTAAVFGHEPPCPECEDGHLEADTGGFGADKISCSNCEYEQEKE